jgi:POT family proton-dependent oligopeptide transporter
VVITVGWVQFQGLWLLEVDRWVDRKVAGFTMPTSWLLAVNAVAIVILTPLSGRLWRGLTVPGRPAAGFAMQFAVAFAIIGVAQLVMGFGFRDPTPGGVSFWWPVGCLLIITIAESIFWPSSYNAIHRITPARSKSLVMGIWLAMLGIGQYVTHQIARSADFLGFSRLCSYIGVSMLIACAALVTVARFRSSLRAL